MVKWLVVLLACLIPSFGFAAETIPVDKLVIQAKIPKGGDFMAFGFDSLWMLSSDRLIRVNAANNSFIEIKIPGCSGRSRGVATGEGAVWIPDTGSHTIYKVDPISNSVVKEIQANFIDSEGSIGIGEGAVWIVALDEAFQTILARFNADTAVLEASIPLDRGSISAVVGDGSVWVTDNTKSQLYRVDPRTNSVASVTALHERPRFLAFGEGAVWVLNQSDDTVQRIDSKTGAVVATIETGGGGRSGGDIVTGGGYVWVTLRGNLPVVQIDPKTNTLLRLYQGFGMGDAIRYGAGSLWVSGTAIHRIEPPK